MKEKLKIHDFQLCFNSNQRLAHSRRQPVRREFGRALGRNIHKVTSVCKNWPTERKMSDNKPHNVYYVYVQTRIDCAL